MNPRTFVIVIAISMGVALASFGELNFVLSGFVCQALGIAFEATRLVSIQKLLSGVKMTPLVSLYFFAPVRSLHFAKPNERGTDAGFQVCAGFNALLIPIFEGYAPFQEVLTTVGAPILIMNASTALLLNIAVVFLIGSASSLVLTLSGVIKDILLVGGSVIILGSTVTFTQVRLREFVGAVARLTSLSRQMFGYSIALVGLLVFKTKQEIVDQYVLKARSVFGR